jgi:iron complex outermembrane recepter protein
MRRQFQKTALSIAAAQAVALFSQAAMAQVDAPPAPAPAASSPSGDKKEPDALQTIVVTGQRKALESAQKIKRDAEEIVDSIVADEAGKLPDRSIAEVLQRVPGVTIDRVGNKSDPQHFSVEGTGVTVRGLSYVRSELNGRDAFSANGGRSLSWSDIPPELMAGIDVYKNPSAEQIEGSIASIINLRTAMPFDYKGFTFSASSKLTYSQLRDATSPDASLLVSNRWDTEFGQFGALVDLAHSENKTRSDAMQSSINFPRSDIVAGRTVWVPQTVSWRREDYDHKRDGVYAALQWKKNDLESSLSFFGSQHKSRWEEVAQWSDNDPYNTVFTNPVFDDHGVFQSGTLSNPSNNGIQLYSNTKVRNETTRTNDLSWNVKWKVDERWTLKSDLQFARSSARSVEGSADIGSKLPSVDLDVSGSTPAMHFDDAARAAMADPANSYWNQMMSSRVRNDGKETAWRGDAQFNFDDAVLRDLRFGVRFTEREAINRSKFTWNAITPTWMYGWHIPNGQAAWLSDPRFSGPTRNFGFDNFFNGNGTTPPSLLVPTAAIVEDPVKGFPILDSFRQTRCLEQGNAADYCAAPFGDKLPMADGSDLNDPANMNRQRETTQAAYATLRFGFDDWAVPVDGNVGLRLVQTHMKADGHTTLNPVTDPKLLALGVPQMSPFDEPIVADHTYTNVLPSLNLRASLKKDLQARFGFSQGIYRPDFSDLQARVTLGQTVVTEGEEPNLVLKDVLYKGNASGNPLLKPIRSNNYDVTLEWYPARSSALTAAVFQKDLKDVIVRQTFVKTLKDDAGNPHDFIVTGPTNGAKARASGIELAGRTYFDRLPDAWAGFGVDANYTYIDSKQSLYHQVHSEWCTGLSADDLANNSQNLGCDTDSRAINNLPMPYLSKNSFNLALLYDYGPVSARVAYSWRGRYLQSVNANGYGTDKATDANPDSPTYGQKNLRAWVPVWADGYGTVDASFYYKFDEQLSLGIEGQNLTSKVFKQFAQQHVGNLGTYWFQSGPRYTVSLRYAF